MRFNTRELISAPGGCSEVLKIALPLVLSTSAFTIQMFVDRVFLTWYGSETMAAAMFSGILHFTIFSLFLGTATYVNTFVAQYDGSGQHKKIGASLWQGIYFSIVSGLLILAIYPLSSTLMNWVGHDETVRQHEVVYFRILCIGAMPAILASTLSCFYTGRGKTWTVMWVNIVSNILNIVLDYAFIFGKWHMPEMGIAGAAWATVLASVLSVVIFIILFLQRKYREDYATILGWKFDFELTVRLMRFGFPSGIQFMLDVFGFMLFVTFVGRISSVCLAATSMTFQINSLAFMPMIGFNMAVCVLTGRFLGQNKPELAKKSTWIAFTITMFYMTVIAAGYWFFPRLFMSPYALRTDPAEFAVIEPIVSKLLCFVAFYCLFDTGNLIFAGALKGAGDTRFVMLVSVVLNWLIMVIPSYLAIVFYKGLKGLYLAWTALTLYVCILAFLFFFRFLAGKWENMRVIETTPQNIPRNIPPVPTFETDLIDR